MKLIFLMAVMVLSLSACDNTKIKLRAPVPPNQTDAAGSVQKTDSLQADTLRTDTIISKKK